MCCVVVASVPSQSLAAMSGFGSVGALNPETSKLFRVRKTVLKMLRKRGYIVDEDMLNMDTESFRSRFSDNPNRDALTILVEKTDDSTDQLFVFFPADEKVGLNPLKIYCQRMNEVSVTRAIVVVKGSLTSIAKNAIGELAQRGLKIEYFKDAELLVDITEHKLVPEHVVLTEDEKKKLLDRYRLKEFQLPRILVTDPVARYLGLERRKVVKINRPSETAGRYVTYRICY